MEMCPPREYNKDKPMKNNLLTKKIIAVAFTIFICGLPLCTLAKNMMPKKDSIETDGDNVLNGNGTTAGIEDKAAQKETEETEVKKAKVTDPVSFMKDSKKDMAKFAGNLVCNNQFVDTGLKFSYVTTGGEYAESSQVILGDEGYLFYKTEADGKPLLDYKGLTNFDGPALDTIGSNLANFKSDLEAKGIDLVVLVVPNKEMVYDQYMPEDIYRTTTYSRGKQLTDYVRDNYGINTYYPIDALKAASQDMQVYYKTDTHMNQIGAFTVLNEIYRDRYGVSIPVCLDDFAVADDNYLGDLATVSHMGILENTQIKDTVYAYKGCSPEYIQDETVLFIGDSFSGFLYNVGSKTFTNVHRVDAEAFSMDMIDEYQPTLVILEAGERRCERLAWEY